MNSATSLSRPSRIQSAEQGATRSNKLESLRRGCEEIRQNIINMRKEDHAGHLADLAEDYLFCLEHEIRVAESLATTVLAHQLFHRVTSQCASGSNALSAHAREAISSRESQLAHSLSADFQGLIARLKKDYGAVVDRRLTIGSAQQGHS